MNAVIGHCIWAVPGFFISAVDTGAQPTAESPDLLCVLNAQERHANVHVTVFYAHRDPMGPYPLTVAARRVRQVRFTDLLEPQAVSPDMPYAAIVTADIPVVVQYLRHDTRQQLNAPLSMIAFPVPQ